MTKSKTFYKSKRGMVRVNWFPARKKRCSLWFFSKADHIRLSRRTKQRWSLQFGIGPLFLTLGPGYQNILPRSSNFIISFKEQVR